MPLIDFEELKLAKALPSSTGIALSIMQMCRREDVQLAELARKIQADPVLAGRIIKIANSVMVNKTRPVLAVTREVLLLIGVEAIRQMALSVSLVSAHQSGASRFFNYTGFWSSSLMMACVAKVIGERIHIAPQAELFTCGLLSGIGHLGLAAVRPQAYDELLMLHPGASVTALMDAERERFGYDRQSLSVAMLQDWNIPTLFVDAVRSHRAPELSGWPENTRRQQLARILNLAAFVANIDEVAEMGNDGLMQSLFSRFETLGLNTVEVTEILEQSSREWCEWRMLL